jgi:hypothetical protein
MTKVEIHFIPFACIVLCVRWPKYLGGLDKDVVEGDLQAFRGGDADGARLSVSPP